MFFCVSAYFNGKDRVALWSDLSRYLVVQETRYEETQFCLMLNTMLVHGKPNTIKHASHTFCFISLNEKLPSISCDKP